MKNWKIQYEKRLKNFHSFCVKRQNGALLRGERNMLLSAKKAHKRANLVKTKGNLLMKDLLLQEKLLGNLGRWEEAQNNRKVALQKSVIMLGDFQKTF